MKQNISENNLFYEHCRMKGYKEAKEEYAKEGIKVIWIVKYLGK